MTWKSPPISDFVISVKTLQGGKKITSNSVPLKVNFYQKYLIGVKIKKTTIKDEAMWDIDINHIMYSDFITSIKCEHYTLQF